MSTILFCHSYKTPHGFIVTLNYLNVSICPKQLTKNQLILYQTGIYDLIFWVGSVKLPSSKNVTRMRKLPEQSFPRRLVDHIRILLALITVNQQMRFSNSVMVHVLNPSLLHECAWLTRQEVCMFVKHYRCYEPFHCWDLLLFFLYFFSFTFGRG